jgi:hypothetical protein
MKNWRRENWHSEKQHELNTQPTKKSHAQIMFRPSTNLLWHSEKLARLPNQSSNKVTYSRYRSASPGRLQAPNPWTIK